MNRHTRSLVTTAALLVLAACASTSSEHRPPSVPTPEPRGTVTDASYDWHVLVLAPFGTLLKDSPLPLHEVLLFRDARGGDGGKSDPETEVESKDCFAIDRAAPRFVGQTPDQYLMCFDHDRLTRVESSVRLTADEAPQVFARACALWLKSTAPGAGSGTACEGRDGSTNFSGRLALVPGDTSAVLSVVLVGEPRNDSHVP